jgi:iron complex transport system permease protein
MAAKHISFISLLLLIVIFIALHLSSQLDMHSSYLSTIIWEIRLPRLILAALSGICLSIAGLLLQTLFRNQLIEAGILGVSAGASLSAVLIIIFGQAAGITLFWQLPIACFIGALILLLSLLWLATHFHLSASELLLVGVTINAFVSAIISLLMISSNNTELRSASFWLMGSYNNADSVLLLLSIPVIILCTLFLLKRHQLFDIWTLGDQQAFLLGLNTHRFTLVTLIIASLLVALSVAQSGGIAFLGLLAPHIASKIGPPHFKARLVFTILIGMLLSIGADFLAKTLLYPNEIPVGIITACIGAPIFLLQTIRARRHDFV